MQKLSYAKSYAQLFWSVDKILHLSIPVVCQSDPSADAQSP